MKTFLRYLAIGLLHLGGLGLLGFGALDSSFLVLPLGNDLLVVALCASHPSRSAYYFAMATAGSVIGCFITDWICRKGESGLRKYV